jgi:hypothetical protein
MSRGDSALDQKIKRRLDDGGNNFTGCALE